MTDPPPQTEEASARPSMVLPQDGTPAAGSGCGLMLLGLLAVSLLMGAMVWGFFALTRPGNGGAASDTPGLSQWQPAFVGDAGACHLEILEAQNVAGTHYQISGVAQVPTGARVWMLAHGEETSGAFWPQLPPISIGPDGSFSAAIYLGGVHQTGHQFEVAVVALQGAEHRRMGKRWRRAMADDWEAIALPPGVCPPSVRAISKPWF